MKLLLIVTLFALSLGPLAKDPPPTTQGAPADGQPQVSGPQGIGEAPLDTCDCPEIEALSTDVRAILEEAYRNQGEVPPFSFDEFTVTLAIQLMSEAQEDCLGVLSGSGARAQLEEWDALAQALPQAQLFDNNGVALPGSHVSLFREATTEGRTMIYHATINGERRAFILRRDENAQVTVEMLYLQTPLEELDLNGEDPNAPFTPPPFDPLLQVQTGPQGIQMERGVVTDDGHLLRFRAVAHEMPGYHPSQDSYQFSAGTTLTYGLDGPASIPQGPGMPSNPTGRELELEANVGQHRHADGTLLNETYDASFTYRDPDRELSFGVTGDERQGDRYNLSFGNAGPGGQGIQQVVQQGTVTRPDLFRLDEDELSFGELPTGVFGQENPFASPVAGLPECSEENTEEIEGVDCEETSPWSYHLEASGSMGSELDRYSFGVAHETEERTSFLVGDADLTMERYNLRGGTATDDTRLSFNLDQNPYAGLDGSVFLERDHETEEGDQQNLTFGLTRDEDFRGDVVHGASFDFTERSAVEETDLGNGFTLSTEERRQYGIEATEDGEVTLGASTFYGETYHLDVQGRGPAEVASYSNQTLATVTFNREGDYSALAMLGEAEMDPFGVRSWEIGLMHTEEGDGRATQGRLRITDSEGVFETPCQVVDLEDLYVQEGGQTFRCRLRISDEEGRRRVEMGFNAQRQLGDRGQLNREVLFVINPDGTTATRARLGAEIQF